MKYTMKYKIVCNTFIMKYIHMYKTYVYMRGFAHIKQCPTIELEWGPRYFSNQFFPIPIDWEMSVCKFIDVLMSLELIYFSY